MSRLLTILLGVLLVVFLLASFVFAVDPAGEYTCEKGVCTLVPVEVEVALTDPIIPGDVFPGAKHNPVEPSVPDPRISEPIVGGPYPDLGYGDTMFDIINPDAEWDIMIPLPVVATPESACGARRACGVRARVRARVRGFRLFRCCR